MRSRGVIALALLLVAAACLGSSAGAADPPASFYVKVHNTLPRAVYLVRCIDMRCLGFEMTIRLSRKATAPIFVRAGVTNVYVVERDDAHRYGCLIFSGVQPSAKTVRRLSPLARCPR